MAVKLEKTRTPGVYRRRPGTTYVVVYRFRGKQRKRAARTYDEARALKAALATDVRRGEHRQATALTFEQYAREWIENYAGRTTRGFRESTRAGYRFSIEQRAVPFFAKRSGTLADIEPQDVRAFVAHLFELRILDRAVKIGKEPVGRTPAVSTVRGHIAALRALLATAVEDGLIRSNPAAGVRVTYMGTPSVEQDAREKRRALDTDELSRFLGACDPDWRALFELLAMTGLRVGELTELRWRDVDFGAKRLRVRRQFYRGVVTPPKSREGTRDIPLSTATCQQLWRRRGADDELIFTGPRGKRLDRDWCWKNVLKPAAKVAGVPWVGFHTFRHTCASILFAQGRNAKQVQMWLGHSDPGFTLRTYVHLLDDGLGGADDLDLAGWATPGATQPTGTQAKNAKAKAA